MNKFFLLLIRLIIGGVVAVIITRMFRPNTEFVYVIGLGAGLVCLTYALEYLRNRKSGI